MDYRKLLLRQGRTTMERKTVMEVKTVGRKTELDAAKGIALFLVVFGHVLHVDSRLSYWIYMFHMQAFFFLSGMTFNPWKYDRIRDFIRDKWKKRMIPYLVITMIGLLICLIRPEYRRPILERGWKDMLLWIFYYGQPKDLYVGQVWFLICLFIAEIIVYGWFRVFGNRSAAVKASSLFILAGIAMKMPEVNVWLPIGHRLPWKIDIAFCAAVFMIAGYYSVKVQLWERLKGTEWFAIPFCLWLSYYYGPKWYGYVNMCDCIYLPGPYAYPVALLGTAAILMLAMLLKRNRFLQYCGRYSMPIFAAQTFAIYWFAELLEWCTGRRFAPMDGIGIADSLWISVIVFLILAAAVYPWHLRKSAKK